MIAHYESSIVTRSGERRLFSWNNTLLRDADGKVTGQASIGEDITDRRRAELELDPGYVSCTQEVLERLPRTGLDANGNPLQCRATTRRGTPCQRVPLHNNGYCPSHQHLAETEEVEVMAASAPIAA